LSLASGSAAAEEILHRRGYPHLPAAVSRTSGVVTVHTVSSLQCSPTSVDSRAASTRAPSTTARGPSISPGRRRVEPATTLGAFITDLAIRVSGRPTQDYTAVPSSMIGGRPRSRKPSGPSLTSAADAYALSQLRHDQFPSTCQDRRHTTAARRPAIFGGSSQLFPRGSSGPY